MAQRISFLSSTLAYSLGIFGSKVVLFALVPIYSFFLNKDELGEYDLVLISITLLTPLITIQLADAVYRHMLTEEERDAKKIIVSSGLKVVLMGYGAFLVLALGINFFFEYESILEFLLLQLSSCLFIFFQQLTRGLGKNKLYAYMGLLSAVFVIAFSAIYLIYFESGIKGILLALFFAQSLAVILVVLFGRIYQYIGLGTYSKVMAKELISYSWPLLPNAISWWLIDLGNRFIILFFLSEAFNGIYAIAARYAGIIALFNSIFILTWQDYTISDKEEEAQSTENASKIFNQFMVFELSAIIVLTSIAKYIIFYTTDEKFHEASNYLPILFLSAGFSAFCAYYGAFYLKNKNTIGVFITTIAGGVVNVIISMSFIKFFGLYAVAIGSLCGFATTLVMRMNHFKIRINYKMLGICLVVYFFVLYIQYLDFLYLSLGIMFFSVILFLFLNKNLFLFLKSKITRS